MKTAYAIIALAAALSCSSCVLGTRPMGAFYTNVADPIAVTGNAGSRTGISQSVSYLGLIAEGDSSIAAAKANGRITTVSSVDVKRKSILGIINTYTTVVKGN